MCDKNKENGYETQPLKLKWYLMNKSRNNSDEYLERRY